MLVKGVPADIAFQQNHFGIAAIFQNRIKKLRT